MISDNESMQDVRDALAFLNSSHVQDNLARLGALGLDDVRSAIKSLEHALSIGEKRAQQPNRTKGTR